MQVLVKRKKQNLFSIAERTEDRCTVRSIIELMTRYFLEKLFIFTYDKV